MHVAASHRGWPSVPGRRVLPRTEPRQHPGTSAGLAPVRALGPHDLSGSVIPDPETRRSHRRDTQRRGQSFLRTFSEAAGLCPLGPGQPGSAHTMRPTGPLAPSSTGTRRLRGPRCARARRCSCACPRSCRCGRRSVRRRGGRRRSRAGGHGNGGLRGRRWLPRLGRRRRRRQRPCWRRRGGRRLAGLIAGKRQEDSMHVCQHHIHCVDQRDRHGQHQSPQSLHPRRLVISISPSFTITLPSTTQSTTRIKPRHVAPYVSSNPPVTAASWWRLCRHLVHCVPRQSLFPSRPPSLALLPRH